MKFNACFLVIVVVVVVAVACAAASKQHRLAEERIGKDLKVSQWLDDLYRLSRLDRKERIVGGREARRGEFSWQLGLYAKMSSGTFFCGGSLIGYTTVLTAAHCVDGATEVLIVAGAHAVNDINEGSQVSRRVYADRAGAIVVHSQFNEGGNLENDIAILNLEEAFPRTTYIQLIGMPRLSDADKDFTAQLGKTSGWGKINDETTSMAMYLRCVEAVVASNAECKVWYGDVINEGHICNSGLNGRSTCDGDNGGPMIIVDQGTEKQLGVVSFGTSLGCSLGYPHVYTRVTSHFAWITEASQGKIVFDP